LPERDSFELSPTDQREFRTSAEGGWPIRPRKRGAEQLCTRNPVTAGGCPGAAEAPLRRIAANPVNDDRAQTDWLAAVLPESRRSLRERGVRLQ